MAKEKNTSEIAIIAIKPILREDGFFRGTQAKIAFIKWS